MCVLCPTNYSHHPGHGTNQKPVTQSCVKTRMVESSSALFNTHLIDTHRYKRPVAHSSSRASLTTTLLYRCYISDQPPLVSARSTNPWCAWLAALQVAPRCPIRAGSLHIVIPHLIITHVHRCTVLQQPSYVDFSAMTFQLYVWLSHMMLAI